VMPSFSAMWRTSAVLVIPFAIVLLLQSNLGCVMRYGAVGLSHPLLKTGHRRYPGAANYPVFMR